jgi:hypothetical protein
MRITVTLVLLAMLLFVGFAGAAEFKGVTLPDRYDLAGQSLQLNGQGMRSKFFFSIYVGALYTPNRVTSASQVMNPQLPKVIRMHFVYDEVSAEKLRDGFVESIDNNIANFSKSADAQKFLNLFDFAAVKNDTIDMQFTPDDTLTVLHNGKQVGQLVSAAASKAVLNIYFGAEPIKSLKTGMLGD